MPTPLPFVGRGVGQRPVEVNPVQQVEAPTFSGPDTESTLQSATETEKTVPAKRFNGDLIFRYLTTLFAFSILAILLVMLLEMGIESLPAIRKFGWKFITSSDWDAVQGVFGALPYLYGSVVSSVLALLLATPLSIGTAVFITEICPKRWSGIIAPLVELLAAIPSVIYGLWGVLVMAPWLQSTVEPFLSEHLGFTPFFEGAPYGVSMLAAIFILVIMVVPIITSITKEVLLAVPQSQKEAAIALGATRWEMILMAVLPYGRPASWAPSSWAWAAPSARPWRSPW